MRTAAIAASAIIAFGFIASIASAQLPPSANNPSLSETLQWLSGASEEESGNGDEHHTFENNGKDCSVTITETRLRATPGFWIKMSFSLADIDPDDIQVNDLGKGDPKMPGMAMPGKFAINIHTTNYTNKIIHTSSQYPEPLPTSHYTYFTNDWFAPKFAKAFTHATRLCGGKRSSF